MLALATSPSIPAFQDVEMTEDPDSAPRNPFAPVLQQTVLNDLSALLANPIIFKEASVTSSTSEQLDVAYTTLDDTKLPHRAENGASKANGVVQSLPSSPPSSKTNREVLSSGSPVKGKEELQLPHKSLWPHPIPSEFPPSVNIAIGLLNTGNTCFLNSVLQCLMHTPQLLQILNGHSQQGHVPGFCMVCECRSLASLVHSKGAPFGNKWTRPTPILRNLHTIAKQMRRGRQEDAHEFLRYSIDALQKSALLGQSPKIPHSLAETTWVHRIFGGRLRSRVMCRQCGHPSDTFDSILDLSIDIHDCDSLREALEQFVAVDRLTGADKYKCEKCNKAVNAEKSFTIHDAPQILTVHLKRFTPTGRKFSRPVAYGEKLNLAPYMSEGQYGPKYNLYAVISHAGGGPNSGHYYAHIKSARGQWYEMNDESVTQVPKPPLGLRNAYILFYRREKSDPLAEIMSRNSGMTSAEARTKDWPNKRRKVEAEEDLGESMDDPIAGPSGEKKDNSFIGPILPSPLNKSTFVPVTPGPDPAAIALNSKIKALTQQQHSSPGWKGISSGPSAKPLACVNYPNSDDDLEIEGPSKPPPLSTPFALQKASSPTFTSIPATNFYGAPSDPKSKKRKFRDGEERRKPKGNNPYSAGLTSSNRPGKVGGMKGKMRPLM